MKEVVHVWLAIDTTLLFKYLGDGEVCNILSHVGHKRIEWPVDPEETLVTHIVVEDPER